MDSKRKNDDDSDGASWKKSKHDVTDIALTEEELDPASAWARPKLPPIDPKTYALGSFPKIQFSEGMANASL